MNLAAFVLKQEHVRRIQHGLHDAVVTAVGEALQDFLFRARIRIADLDLHQEAVELRFRQRIRAVMLGRILCRENHERTGKRIGGVFDRHLIFVHRFQQRALGFRRGAIDFVGKNDVGEDRAGLELEVVELSGLKTDTPRTSEGSRSLVNWMRWKLQPRDRARA